MCWQEHLNDLRCRNDQTYEDTPVMVVIDTDTVVVAPFFFVPLPSHFRFAVQWWLPPVYFCLLPLSVLSYPVLYVYVFVVDSAHTCFCVLSLLTQLMPSTVVVAFLLFSPHYYIVLFFTHLLCCHTHLVLTHIPCETHSILLLMY